jgi:hypothetical protein
MDFPISPKEAELNRFLNKQLTAMMKNYEDAGRPNIPTPFYKNLNYTKEGITKLLREDPTMGYHYLEKKRLCEEGRLTWAAMIQSNEILFNLDEIIDTFGVYYVSGCDYFEKNPSALWQLAKYIYEFKSESKTGQQSYMDFGKYLRDEEGTYLRPTENEKGCHLNMRHKIADNTAYFTTILFVRDHLYCRILVDKPIPVLHLPTKYASTILLPVEFWTKEYKDFYISPSLREQLVRDHFDELFGSLKVSPKDEKEFFESDKFPH